MIGASGQVEATAIVSWKGLNAGYSMVYTGSLPYLAFIVLAQVCVGMTFEYYPSSPSQSLTTVP